MISGNFNPRTSCEVRLLWIKSWNWLLYFNPRTSCEVRHFFNFRSKVFIPFQSTHLVWGATDFQVLFFQCFFISIHAPRVRCDVADGKLYSEEAISIHAPRVRCDYLPPSFFVFVIISIHAPRVRCDDKLYFGQIIYIHISIHAPRVRCDVIFCISCY